jgi:CheY-like chemotaxis protein
MMNNNTLPDFIIIDDDPINNLICQKMVELTIKGSFMQTFTEPEKGLEYLMSAYAAENAKNAILFLDINMPHLNGWDVLERFKNFPGSVKQHIKIYMLSSSVDPQDQEKAGDSPLVSGFISKPLSQAKLQTTFPDLAAQSA